MSWVSHAELRWYRADIEDACRTHRLDPELVAGLILTESSGKPSAYRYEPGFYKRYKLASHPVFSQYAPGRVSASYGLTQVLFVTAYELGCRREPEELFVPRVNLQWGGVYLRKCLDWATQWHGNDKETLISALASYNGGRNSAQKPPSPRNAPYALRVLQHMEALK